MKALLALLLCAAACFADVAPPERREPGNGIRVSPREPGSRPALRRATVTLVDGSVLHGDLRPRFLPAFSPNLGRVRIDLAAVERIEFETAPGQQDSEAGIRVSPREPGFGFREPRRETRAAPGAASETRRETRLPNPETRPSGGCAAGPCGRGGAAPWVPMQGRIAFRNGDRLTVRFRDNLRFLPFDTLLGRVRLPLRAVSSLAIASDETDALIYHCTFDSASSIAHPAAGPAGAFLGGEFVPGKKGNALRIPGNVPTALVDLPRGMMQPRGTIEFWSKIENPPASYGDRGNPRFFGLSLFDDPANPGPCSTYLQFTSNDGMGMSGLCGMIYHRAMATDPHMRTNTYGPILEDSAAWHHYAIVWDSDGLSFSKASDGTPAVAAIVLDGHVLQTFGRNQFAHGKGLLRLPELQGKLAFPVADTGWGYFPRPVAFLIDEFKIWSKPKTEFE